MLLSSKIFNLHAKKVHKVIGNTVSVLSIFFTEVVLVSRIKGRFEKRNRSEKYQKRNLQTPQER